MTQRKSINNYIQVEVTSEKMERKLRQNCITEGTNWMTQDVASIAIANSVPRFQVLLEKNNNLILTTENV